MRELFTTECYTLLDALVWFALGIFVSGALHINKKRGCDHE